LTSDLGKAKISKNKGRSQMAIPRKGIIQNLEEVLAQLLETNEALNERLAQMEAVLIGGVVAGRRGRKP
jgi:hypothetical protein